ncbi:cation diffusion facilitator CzcD-associated flavoprotein CzcO [Rhodococcus fascians]|uniref:flavin-containing monooxygenase n=1 Tax=Nocardiaceae TaxID=85025 RepID=UPI00286765E1|nr:MULTISPECIES: NAD(P)/FAD-dependent oxidoreductase [Rhodococcus]MDR6911459.1 cation diffusion facilitator CzcD-associated flavoprotein CzcO [Rhodococcus sp. 3258]MDR6933018.1 cation diffusion facilitator CzcD-associated flavoprotein CzcO [Rhodococcus fascians]
MNSALPQQLDVLVVGAGFAGLAAVAKILAADPSADVTVIERASEVGGTWRDNTYPGCACDVPTSLYSFSFAPSPKWSHTFARQPELFDYLQSVVERLNLRDRIVTDCELLSADWSDTDQRWTVQTSKGAASVRVLIAATGALSTPKIPDVPGIDTFQGTVFHSATWNHEHDLTGERVAVIGTGASAVQFVPEIVDKAQRLTVFQRTPAWVIPRLDRTIGRVERTLYGKVPAAHRAVRGIIYGYREAYVTVLADNPWMLPAVKAFAKANLKRQVKNPTKRAALTPDYAPGCKRLLLSNDWLRTLDRPDVDLVTSGLTSVTENGVVDASGRNYEVDTIIFATGFTPTEPPVSHLLRGSDGRTLAERWGGSPQAHLGTTVAGFPNLFLMYGPNTNLGHSSIVYMLESQANYVVSALSEMRDHHATAVEVSESAQQQHNSWVDSSLDGTVWNAGGCSSWYLDANGRNSTMWPTYTFRFRNKTRTFDTSNYRLVSDTRESDKKAVSA